LSQKCEALARAGKTWSEQRRGSAGRAASSVAAIEHAHGLNAELHDRLYSSPPTSKNRRCAGFHEIFAQYVLTVFPRFRRSEAQNFELGLLSVFQKRELVRAWSRPVIVR